MKNQILKMCITYKYVFISVLGLIICAYRYNIKNTKNNYLQIMSKYDFKNKTQPLFYITYTSDGIVTEASQKGEGQAWSSNAKFIEAIGVNHREYGDHPEMDINVWPRIWGGEVDPNFKIKER